jgi:hypothetical protein
MRVNRHSVGSPSQASVIVFGQVGRSAYHKKTEKFDMPMSEVLSESCGIFVVVEREEPIDQLPESMLKPPTPFFGRLTLGLIENASGPRVFKLDCTKCFAFRVTDNDVGREVAEDIKFIRQSIRGAKIWTLSPDEC